MVLAPLLAAPAVMFAATAAERRYGAAVAGLVGAAPVALAVVILSVGDGAVAMSAAAHVVAQVAFAVAFALVVVRRGAIVGAPAGAGAYAVVSAGVEFVPAAVATAAAFPALLLAPRLLPDHPRDRGLAPSHASSALGAAASVALVGSALTAAHYAGPEAAGAIGAFPAVSTAFALVLARSRGTRTAANALKGLTVGLRGYLAFCLVVAATGPAGIPLGLVVCAAQSLMPRNSVRPGPFGSVEKPSPVYRAMAAVFDSLTSSSIRRQPRARARSKQASVSALPSPVPRADSCTNRSSSQQSSAPVHALSR
jgi:hypothetical protein